MTGKAWQRQMREQIEQDERTDGDAYWESYDLDIGHAEVRPIDANTAREVIEQYEWLGKMAAVNWYCFGIFFGKALGGVAVYGPEYCENLGRWDRFGYTGKIILLSRGACAHWAHPHSASKLTRGSMRLLPARFEVVTATVDSRAGEVGTIYQAAGFDYVGSIAPPDITEITINGVTYSTRALRARYGTRSPKKLGEMFGPENVVAEKRPAKERYFAFRGGKVARKHNRAAIAHLIKPYPRRDAEAVPAQVYQGRLDLAA